MIWAGPLLAYPAVWLGRLVLDRHRSASWTTWTTAVVQLCMGLALGVPLVRAIASQSGWPGMVVPVIYGAGCRTRITAQVDALFFVREATPLPDGYRDLVIPGS